MPTWLKIVLVIVASGLFGLMAIGLGGYWWVSSNRGRFEEIGKRAKADAVQFAATHDGAQCVQEALRRLDRVDGIMARAEVKVFLSSCMDEARESPGMCDGVPPNGEIMWSVAWAVEKCTQLGRPDDQPCRQLILGIQNHCDKRGQQPALPAEAGAEAAPVAGKATGRTFPGGEVLPFNEGMTRPERIRSNDLVYTAEALKARVEGKVSVKCIIATDGLLYDCRIVKSLPFMEKTILDALASRRYKPVKLQGKPVNVEYVFNVTVGLPSSSAVDRTPVPPIGDKEYTEDLRKICYVHEITGKSAELGFQGVADWLIGNIRTRAARHRLAERPFVSIPLWLRDLRRDAAARGVSRCPFSDTWEEFHERYP